jgi:nitrous oxide reductase accessory protein NosL
MPEWRKHGDGWILDDAESKKPSGEGWEQDEKGRWTLDTNKLPPKLAWLVRFGLGADDTKLFDSRNQANKFAREFGGRVMRRRVPPRVY